MSSDTGLGASGSGHGDDPQARGPRPQAPGILFVVSAPSGTGKTTLVERLVQVVPNLAMSRSYTSRAARDGEADGVDYNFISRKRFEDMAHSGEFLEWADVFGNLYGTREGDTLRCLEQGCDVVLVIDVQGARQVRARLRDVVQVFVLPPSFEILERRLRGRSKDAEQAIQKRLRTARAEVAAYSEYDYVVVNDEFDACVERLKGIVFAERARLPVMRPAAEQIVGTFQQEQL
jgi:guanylate kinase